jgi:AbiEi antitoxin C-terminal domain
MLCLLSILKNCDPAERDIAPLKRSYKLLAFMLMLQEQVCIGYKEIESLLVQLADYTLLPPEHKSYGSIPAEELIPIMMKHIDAEYYAALPSAAGFYGASHQKPMVFQIVTNRRIKHSLKFGLVHIKLIHKNSLTGLPIKDFVVSTGYLKVATLELIVIDLLK